MSQRIFFILMQLLLAYFNLLHAHDNLKIGKIHFLTSANQAAQPYFEKGVMLLHSFEYEMARLAFQQAQNLDPEFALAYWGEAMTYNHTLWGEQDMKAALQVLNKLASTAELRIQKAKTLKEKGLMNAINSLYGKGDRQYRDNEYAKHMRELYRQYPEDDEIASFYALALFGSTEGERDFRIYMQAGSIADEINIRHPNHPGALHYAIHAFDDPIHASLGLRAARNYAKIAPDAAHALHMPSHIFMALGMWDEVITSNSMAWQAGIKHNPQQIAKAFTIDDIHALHWLTYAYLQKHNFATAYQWVKKMERITAEADTPMTKWYYTLMRAAYILETKQYHVNLKLFNLSGIELSARATDLYVTAFIALQSGDIHKAKDAYHHLKKILADNTLIKGNYKNYFTAVTKSGNAIVNIIALQLQALIALHENKLNGLSLLKTAANLENKMSFGYGPPLPIVPASELLAEHLLLRGKIKSAYRAYVTTLLRNPHRLLAAQGLAITKQILKNKNIALPVSIHPYFNKLMRPEYYH